MRILVTGGAGFIGSHLAETFLAAGHRVAIVDNLSTGRRGNVPPGAALHVGDIREEAAAAAIDRFRPEVLCHQAAQIDLRRSVADPAFDADVNIVGTLRLLEACRRVGTRRVLFASTGGAMYGEQGDVAASEDTPAQPISPYGAAKRAVELYLHYYEVEHGFRVTALRYANVYGPRQSPHGEAGVVAIFADRLATGGHPVIFGDGEQTRDYVHVADVVRANLAVLEADLTGTFNVGTGVETSVIRVFDELNRHAGGHAERTHGPARLGEQRRSYLDASRLTRATGWKPLVFLEDGLAETYRHFAARQ